MGTTDFILLVVMGACGILCSVGGGLMIATSNEHRQAARVAFVAAGVLFWMTGVIWGINSMESSMSIRFIVSGLVGAVSAIFTVWMFTLSSNAQTPPAPPSSSNGSPQTVIQNGGGGIGMDLTVSGTPGSPTPTVGLQTNGLQVIQNGHGTGMKVTVGGNGPAIGVQSTVGK